MHEDWKQRWREGRIGWHEHEGSAALKKHWRASGRRVLVPLCGKTPDLRWLAEQGHEVVGVELSELAIEGFFAEQGLDYVVRDGELPAYESTSSPITIYCGDYFALNSVRCDAHYDRGALVAMPQDLRPAYVAHTNDLLQGSPERLVITLAYDQNAASGPPFSVSNEELLRYWPGLIPLEAHNDIDHAPPKFRAAGLSEVIQTVWRSA